ncbi:MAG: VWA domain-containing protein [Planctomycetaceae bacterium]|nr:VWA domain-containing protein [Planctomycetales bacterium]MCB9937904.1 VWA domain-containing protein [Planctomycetaceae bacterium]
MSVNRQLAAIKCRRLRRLRRARRRGVMVILMLFLLVGLLAAAAFSVDVAYMQLVRTELRRATDAGARAGGEALSRTEKVDIARAAAKAAAASNTVAGQPLVLDDADIVFGNSAQGRDGKWFFTANAQPFNSVQVDGDRTAKSATGNVALFFGKAFGTDSFAPSMSAIVMQGESSKRDFAVVVDRSGSMAWDSGGRGSESRWEALLTAFGGFLSALADTKDEEEVGLVSYASSSSIDEYLTDRHNDPTETLNRLRPSGSTNIYSGIVNGTTVLTRSGRARSDAVKIMVVMTDGQHNTGPEPVVAARAAATEKIVIYTITFGDGADITRMRAVADATGGKHYHAPTAADLRAIFRKVVTDSEGLAFVK